jgi:hypothetical protein
MRINFFLPACIEPTLNDALFGICDDKNGTKAYTNKDDPSKWIAVVKNRNRKELTFTAIDNCILKSYEQPGKGRCDGMLTSDDQIFFIELKDQAKNWKTDSISQLESTIEFFIESHDISIYKHKKAFACNKQHQRFQEVDNALNVYFFRKYKVRIDVQAEIIVV